MIAGILSGLVGGIGFLGAGVIRSAEDGREGTGLTTAASVWGVAAVGVTAALGHYVLAAGAALLLVLILRALTPLERRR